MGAPSGSVWGEGFERMSQESCWPAYLWGGIFAVALMGGAASLGGSAWDRLEYAKGPVIVSLPWQGIEVAQTSWPAIHTTTRPAD